MEGRLPLPLHVARVPPTPKPDQKKVASVHRPLHLFLAKNSSQAGAGTRSSSSRWVCLAGTAGRTIGIGSLRALGVALSSGIAHTDGGFTTPAIRVLVRPYNFGRLRRSILWSRFLKASLARFSGAFCANAALVRRANIQAAYRMPNTSLFFMNVQGGRGNGTFGSASS